MISLVYDHLNVPSVHNLRLSEKHLYNHFPQPALAANSGISDTLLNVSRQNDIIMDVGSNMAVMPTILLGYKSVQLIRSKMANLTIDQVSNDYFGMPRIPLLQRPWIS